MGEMQDIDNAVRIAANDALTSFSNLDFGKGNGSAETYDITQPENREFYEGYLNQLEQESKSKGIFIGSDMETILGFLKKSLKEFLNGKETVFTPMQFGYTYLDESVMGKRFEQSVRKLIQQNYSKENNGVELAFTGDNRIRVNDTEAKIVKGPVLLDLRGANAAGHGEHRSFGSIFGTARQEALEMVGEQEAGKPEYDYVIAYDIEFQVQWEHHTVTPFFLRNRYGDDKPGYLDDRDQLVIQMPKITYRKRYILTN